MVKCNRMFVLLIWIPALFPRQPFNTLVLFQIARGMEYYATKNVQTLLPFKFTFINHVRCAVCLYK
jgi:hypothetical protein